MPFISLHSGQGCPVEATYKLAVSRPETSDTPPDEPQEFETLPLGLRLPLEIVSLVGAATSLRRLIEIGRHLLEHEPIDGASLKDFTPARLGPALTKLVDQQFLLEANDDFVCRPDLMEPVAVAAYAAGRAVPIATLLLKSERWTSKSAKDATVVSRNFRLYLYSGDFAQARGLANLLEQFTRQRAWSDLGRQLSTARSFLAFPPEVALHLARETLMQSLNRAFPASAALRAFGELVNVPSASVKDKQLYGHALLMSDDRDALEDFLDQHDFPTLEGCRRLLDGDLSGLDHFERGLSESKFFASYTALFLYLVAILAKEGLDSPRARQELSRYIHFRTAFEWMLAVKAGQITEFSSDMRRLLQEPPEALVPHISLILYWAGFRHEGSNREKLGLDYAQAGYPVFAQWLLWAADSEWKTEPRPPLLDLLQADEHWRKVLLSLNAWSAPSRESLHAATDERIVWQIEPFAGKRRIEPRVQRQSRRGGWSSGRLLDLQELSDKPPVCADVHDRKVIEALQRLELNRRHIGHVGGQDQLDVALLALAGHPRVSLRTAPEEMVELVEEPVGVVVRRFPTHLEVQLDPKPVWQPMVLAEQAEPGRVRLFNITPRHVQLGRVIDSNLKVPLEGEAELQDTLAGLATAGLALRSDIELKGEAEEVEPDSTLLIRLSPYSDGLSVQVRVAPLGQSGPMLAPGEGSPVVAGRVRGRSLQTRRQLEAEAKVWASLQQTYPALLASDFVLTSPLESLQFLEGFAVHDEERRFRLEWPEGEKFAVARTLRLAELGQRVRSGTGAAGSTEWFTLGAQVQVDEDMVLGLGELLERRRASGSRFLHLSGGRYLALTEELESYLERIDRLAQRQTKEGEVQLHPLVGLLALQGQDNVQTDDEWEGLQQRWVDSQKLKPRIPKAFRGELRSYQEEGVRWLLRLAEWGVGACLADDMGLGKTVQLLAVLLSRSSLGPALVVAPTSVCWNWVEEARRFAPDLRMLSLVEASRLGLASLGANDVLVLSYGVMVNQAEALAAIPWATTVLDEAQAIKNPNTQRAKAVFGLQAGFRIAATGTPVENHPDEMWSLFRYLNPGLLGSLKTFGRRFGSSTAGQEDLARLVRPFILRRTKQQVLKELPPRTEILEKIPLSEQERALYETLRREAVTSLNDPKEDYISVLAQLTRLRRACCHPRLVFPDQALGSSKLERCLELVEELLDNGHRALIFSQFVSYLHLLRVELDERAISYAYLDGSTSGANRRKSVQAFQGGVGEVFLISLKAGGTGLNLTAADYVIHLDPWWNPAVEDQASDRAHRMGQLRPVTVYRLVAEATVEEQIVELHSRKRDLADRLLQGTEGSDRLSAADLRELLA